MNFFRFVLVAALAGAPLVFGVETKSWVHNDRTDFEKGTLKNLSMRSDGLLTLAPSFREVADPSTAYLWALAVDSKGTLYTGGGNPGSSTSKLIAVEPSGKSRVVADLPGLQIQTIAVDKRDRVYAATAPDGKVYRITVEGKFEVFYDPKAHYIWALAFNSKGELFVATGDSGEIHRVGADGKGSVFFRTEETHARSMAVDSKDNLIVGTEPGGLVIRVAPDGNGFVLYQASRREVTSVAVASDGSIWAAAIGNKTGSGGVSLAVPVPPTPAPAAPNAPAATAARPPGTVPPTAPPPPSIAGGSEVYRIGTDGFPQKMWTHATDIVYTISFDAAGRPVVGTGNKGNIYLINSSILSTLLINADPTQVTALATGPNKRLYAVTGNVGKVYEIGPNLEKQGNYESEPLDVGSFSYWGRASAKSDLKGGKVHFDTRSGNLDRPQKNWSPWAPPGPEGRVTSPSARFLQYRLTFDAATNGTSPEVREIEIAYKTKNVAPVIEQIEITPANYKFTTPAVITTSAPQTISLAPLGAHRRASSLSVDTSTSSSMTYAKGYTGARWSVTDPNGDDLQYKLEIRGINEKEWKLVRDKIREKYASWDSTAYADGDYVLRLTATDAPDNPPDQALASTLESDRFIIDNTPPRISNLAGSRSAGKLNVKWRARDERGIISKAEYSINGTDWTPVEPTTRLSDAPELEYSLSVDAPQQEATVAVRVTDEYDNQSVEKTVIK